jgi:hypothetical protein
MTAQIACVVGIQMLIMVFYLYFVYQALPEGCP